MGQSANTSVSQALAIIDEIEDGEGTFGGDSAHRDANKTAQENTRSQREVHRFA